MDPQRDGLAHRRAVVVGIEALLVEAVADFVEDAEERVAEVVLVVPGGDPAIARPDARAERVGGHVQPAALEVEADRRGDRLAEDSLAVARIEPVQDRSSAWRPANHSSQPARRAMRLFAPAVSAILRDQGNKLAPQRLEENGQLGGRGAGLVVVEKGIVDRPRRW